MLKFKNGDLEKPRSYMRIYDGDDLIRDFAICINPEGTIGAYDLVNDKFYEMTDCVVIQEGDYTKIYTKPEYEAICNLIFDPITGGQIIYTGEQYIDTGVKPDI